MVLKGTPRSLTQSSTVFALLESVARKDGALKGKTYWGLFFLSSSFGQVQAQDSEECTGFIEVDRTSFETHGLHKVKPNQPGRQGYQNWWSGNEMG